MENCFASSRRTVDNLKEMVLIYLHMKNTENSGSLRVEIYAKYKLDIRNQHEKIPERRKLNFFFINIFYESFCAIR
jgi:hypothetical protein